MISCNCKKVDVNNEPVYIYPINYKIQSLVSQKVNANSIRTTKYRFYNFLFLNLYEQFKRYSNIFFVFCVIINFIPEVSAYSKEVAAVPILIVLLITLFKDGWEDLNRWRSDRMINRRIVQIYNHSTKKFGVSQWRNVKEGDFIKLSANERVPADILIYYSSNTADGACLIETSDIDGETNLKQRSIIKFPTEKNEKLNEDVNLENQFYNYFFQADGPNKEIYKFNGKMLKDNVNTFVKTVNSSNLILRDSVLRKTDEIRGIVVYAGQYTKVMMNNIQPRFKRSLLEEQLNTDNLWCVGILLIICFMCAIGHGLWITSYSDINTPFYFEDEDNAALKGFIIFWTSIIIYQSTVPLPLYLSMEIVRGHQILHMKSDIELYNEELEKQVDVKAYNILEDLGQINHMFCDKTGTLTRNEMIFKKASIYGKVYSCEDDMILTKDDKLRELQSHKKDRFFLAAALCNTLVITKNSKCEKHIVHLDSDYEFEHEEKLKQQVPNKFGINEFDIPIYIEPISIEEADAIPKDLSNPDNNEKSQSVKSSSFQTSTSLFTQRANEMKDKPEKEIFELFLSESPDEEALVKMAFMNGYKLIERSLDWMIIYKEDERKILQFDVLRILPFDSTRKCMSIVLKRKKSQVQIITKGADCVMFDKIKNCAVKEKTMEDIDEFAVNGLRTMVFAERKMTLGEYQEWEKQLNVVLQDHGENESEVMNIYSILEDNMDIIGASGIEDKLQDNVPEVLECLKEAGINIWILTGDKQETAVNIAYSTRLFAVTEKLIYVNGKTEYEVFRILQDWKDSMEQTIRKECGQEKCNEHQEFGLVIDSHSLSFILDQLDKKNGNSQLKPVYNLCELFVHVTYLCNSVVCCRCTPIQKAQLVELVKKYFKFRTLAIGDGANDVNMIRTADIGVGIGGKEGQQASMAADFAITKFDHLKRLILVHGHWNYDRLARMSLFIFYKDILYALTLFFYQILCGFSGAAAVDQVTQILFHLVPTGLPPVIFGIWEKDFDDRVLMANPQIYKTGINSKMYRPRDFWRNVTDAIYQSLIIFIVIYFSYRDTDTDMGEVGIVTSTIMTLCLLAVFIIESKHWSIFHWISVIGSLAIGFYLLLFTINSMCVVLFDCLNDNPYKIFHYTMAQRKTYLVIVVACSAAIFPRITLKSYLSQSRKSIGYTAQGRISEKEIPRIGKNICNLRDDGEFDEEQHFRFNHQESNYYLGDLEMWKKIFCRKCDLNQRFINSEKVENYQFGVSTDSIPNLNNSTTI